MPPRLIKKTIFVAATITGGALVLAIAGVITLLVVDGRSAAPPGGFEPHHNIPIASEYDDTESESISEDILIEEEDIIEADDGGVLRPPARTNFLLVGIDDHNLADAIIVGCFYRDTGDIKLMAIPRDMYTRLPTHRLEQMRAEGLRPPTFMKINAVRTHGGRNGMYYLKSQLGEMLGVEFHYYAEVHMDAFSRIVDAFDGVWFDVPVPMVFRPYADQAPVINLSPGWQRLDGETALQLVRFRGFPTGDIARNESQIDFMVAMMSQMLTRDAFLSEPLTLINIVLNDVNSNIGLNVVRYIPYIRHMSSERITTFTMPGRGAYVGGISWFLPDAGRVPDMINQVFYANPAGNDEEE
ncbi:MAG: LCP family protein [Defluviitaleaceae bacterium]|nr:LCP family protein [Defluviitaleaceae bacterium]